MSSDDEACVSPADADPVPVLDAESASDTVRVHVQRADGSERTLLVPRGATLRDALLAGDCSPYAPLAKRANCGGRGLCATCGVRYDGDPPDSDHWHDRLADRFGYPRLSCQLSVTEDCAVEIPEKRLWGSRK
jgi:ferredoxin